MTRRGSRSSARSAIPTTAYHGAHHPTVDSPPVRRWEGERCVAFVHDVMAGPALPDEYGPCDVYVTDLPWRVGFDTFNERAGIDDGRTYPAFMRRVAEIVEALTVPTWLVTGRHALPALPAPDVVLPTVLNEDKAVAVGFRPGPEAGGRFGVAQELLHALASNYDVVGDFCCGYGRAGRFFLRAGKRAVLSDVNPSCVGYIAAHAPGWSTKSAQARS